MFLVKILIFFSLRSLAFFDELSRDFAVSEKLAHVQIASVCLPRKVVQEFEFGGEIK